MGSRLSEAFGMNAIVVLVSRNQDCETRTHADRHWIREQHEQAVLMRSKRRLDRIGTRKSPEWYEATRFEANLPYLLNAKTRLEAVSLCTTNSPL